MSGTDLVAATLAGIRERANQRITAPFDSAAAIHGSIKSAADVPRLLAAVEAALKLADPEPCAPDLHPEHPMIRVVRCDELRAAITAALTGKEAGNEA